MIVKTMQSFKQKYFLYFLHACNPLDLPDSIYPRNCHAVLAGQAYHVDHADHAVHGDQDEYWGFVYLIS